jgi:photosystem II stability/assembly factor-like uncharacterized protein
LTAAPGWPAGYAVFQLARGPNRQLYAAGETPYGAAPALWQRTATGAWQPLPALPPAAGTGSALLSVLATADTLLVGLDGAGLFTSRDGGNAWQPVAAIGETFVAALWVAPWDETLLLARTRRGLWRSSDGGTRWQETKLATDARIDSITAYGATGILLGLGDGTLRFSNDGGQSWQPWGSPLGRAGLFYTLQVAPDSPVTLLAGTQHGLARSIDGGLNWQRVQIRGTPRTFYPVTALTQTPDGILYLGSNDGVYQSSTRGTQWQPFSTALPRQRVLALTTTTRRDTGTSVLFAGTEVGLYRRYADESYWRALGWAGAVPGLALHPTDPNQLYLRAAFERIYASQAALSPEPGDVAWEQRGAGMALTSEIMALAIDPTDPQVLYAGGAVELFKSTDGAQSWQRIDPPLLSGQSIFALLINPDRPTELWAGATNGLYHSMDSGASWQSSSSALENITINTLARHPTNPAILLAGTKYNGLWYTLDGGQQWQQAATLPATATIDALVIDRDDTAASADGAYGNWIYAATDHGFWRGRLPVPTPTVHAPTENAPTENAREGAAP